ncbi:hypothetical protein [Streptomyces albidochromogenes]|uniref:Extensin n=1 Tax=Streptomyces albidochromogenes TaxID=329524 RepID=A0ABW6FZQ4_9ACTN
MADERYEWLDRDAAERLLRGEPVGPVGEHARAQAERLAAALDGVARAGGQEAGELPGEAAALAAFRKARATAPESVTTVRIERRASAPLRWGRPVRIGLAGALAGVALGGVAVAAGTGVLPSPFGRGTGPAPASSVSAAVTPPPATPGTTAADPDGTGGPTPDSTTPGTAPGTPGDGNGGQGGDTGGTHTPSAGPDGVTPPAFPDWAGDGRPGTGDGSGDARGSGDWYRATVEACRDYRSGSLAPHHERRLEEAAKGADRVERFCDRLLDGSRDEDGGGTGSGDGGRNSGGHNGGRDGHDRDDDGDDRYDGGGEDGRSGDGRTTDGRRISPDGAQRLLPAVPYAGLPAATAGSDAPAETLTYPS